MLEEPKIAFNDWLRNKRLDLGMTQTEFAKFTGVSRVSISWYEQGKSIPSFKAIEKFAKALNTSYSYIREIIKGE